MSRPSAELLARISSPETAAAAAEEWLMHPEWMYGQPPADVTGALLRPRGPDEGPLIELLRGWDPEPMTRTLLEILDTESDDEVSVRAAWLLKVAPARSSWRELMRRVRENQLGRQPRRYLLEALDRLAFARAISWGDVEPMVAELRGDADPGVREALVGLLMSLRMDDAVRRALLIGFLSDANDTVVAVATVALRGYDIQEQELDPELVRRLRDHPNPSVREGFRELVAS
jgi:hypothetical protein